MVQQILLPKLRLTLSRRIGRNLTSTKEVVLARGAAAAFAGALVIGIGHAPAIGAQKQEPSEPGKASPSAFEVASVRPHVFARNQFAFGTASRESPVRISGSRVTVQGLLAGLVRTAYKLRTFQVSGIPEWRDETGRN